MYCGERTRTRVAQAGKGRGKQVWARTGSVRGCGLGWGSEVTSEGRCRSPCGEAAKRLLHHGTGAPARGMGVGSARGASAPPRNKWYTKEGGASAAVQGQAPATSPLHGLVVVVLLLLLVGQDEVEDQGDDHLLTARGRDETLSPQLEAAARRGPRCRTAS